MSRVTFARSMSALGFLALAGGIDVALGLLLAAIGMYVWAGLALLLSMVATALLVDAWRRRQRGF